MNKRIVLAAGICALTFAATVPTALAQNRAAAASGQAVIAAEGVVVEVQGQRIKVRAADGRTQWYSVDAPVSQNHVGQKVRGVVDQVGDALRLSSAAFSPQ